MIIITITDQEIEARLRELNISLTVGNTDTVKDWLEGIATDTALTALQELDAGTVRAIPKSSNLCQCIVIERRSGFEVWDSSNCPIHGHN